MPNSSNQARVGAGEPLVRIERVRTASIVASSRVVVGAERQQREVGVLERRRRAQQPGDLVDEVLQVVPHDAPLAAREPCRPGRHTVYESTGRVLDICPWLERVAVPSVLGVAVPRRRCPCSCRRPCSPHPAGLDCAGPSTGNPATRRVVDRFVAGETLDQALTAVRALDADGVRATLDHLGEDITSRAEADALPRRLPRTARRTGPARAGRRCAEVSVKLSAFGQALPGGHDVALELVRPVVEAATAAGHHGHPRHGGPPHGRLHARRPRRAAQGAPRHRCGAAGDAAPHRGRRQGPRRHRLPGPAGEGRVRRAGDRGAPAREGRRRRLRCGAWRSSWPAPGTRWSARTTRR